MGAQQEHRNEALTLAGWKDWGVKHRKLPKEKNLIQRGGVTCLAPGPPPPQKETEVLASSQLGQVCGGGRADSVD